MAGEVTLAGTVVAQDPDSPFQASPNDGLYLMTDEKDLLRLIRDHMATQMPTDVMHRQSRLNFEPHLGKRVTVQGYRSGDTIYGAFIVD